MGWTALFKGFVYVKIGLDVDEIEGKIQTKEEKMR